MLDCLFVTCVPACSIYLQAFEALVKEMGAAADKCPQNDTLTSHNYRLHESVDGGSPKMRCLRCF